MRLRPLLFIVAVLAAPPAALAQTGGPYDLSWSSIPGGGQNFAQGGAYTLGGSTGQAIAGELAGGAYALSGGFWVGAVPANVGVATGPDPIPRAFGARTGGPNPFAGSTSIQFELPAGRDVAVAVFGLDGRAVRRLLDGHREAGRHAVVWDGRDDGGHPVTPGVYFVRVEAGHESASLRLVRLH